MFLSLEHARFSTEIVSIVQKRVSLNKQQTIHCHIMDIKCNFVVILMSLDPLIHLEGSHLIIRRRVETITTTKKREKKKRKAKTDIGTWSESTSFQNKRHQ